MKGVSVHKKNHINEAHRDVLQKNNVKQYDEVAQTIIKKGIIDESASSEVHHDVLQKHINDTVSDVLIDMLKKELEIKNEQIRDLNKRLEESNAALVSAQQTAQAAQALHAGTIQKQISAEDNYSNEKKVFFLKWFGKK